MNKRTKFITLLAVVIMCMAAALGVVGCKNKNGGFAISQSEVSVPMNGTVNLTATLDGNAVAAQWSIDKTDIATLTVIGNLCIVKPTAEGTATITASYDGKTATCALTVTPDNTETITVTDADGNEVSAISVDMGASKTLTATASQGSAITWESSNEHIATVENGVITGGLGGTCVVTAKVNASIKKDITVTVNPPADSDYYWLKFAEEDGSKIASVDYSEAASRGEYFYWGGKYEEFGHAYQEVTVEYAYFQDDQVNVKYTCDTDEGNWMGFQLFYKHPDHELGKVYKLNCVISIDVDCSVTLNGEEFDLESGKDNELEVYYVYTSGMSGDTGTDKYGMSSLDLVMGIYKTSFVQNAEFTIKNMTWVEDTSRVTLQTPSFTYNADTKVININDPNTAGVGGYTLKLYNENGVAVSTIPVKNGEAVDLSYTENGTYTAKLTVRALNPHYIDSPESTVTASITVENANGPTYTMTNNNEVSCTDVPGRWTYWSSDWVVWSEDTKFANGALTAGFSNNAGNWDDTILFYKNPSDVNGTLYKMTLNITAPNDGRVTAGGSVITLKEGAHDYDFFYVAKDGSPSFTIIFGVTNEPNQQEIQAGPVIIVIQSIVKHDPVALETPTATVTDGTGDNVGKKIIAIQDNQNNPNNCTYEVGFFSSTDALEDKVVVENGKAIDITGLVAGTYTMKIRAHSTSLGYLDSEWSASIGEITTTGTIIRIREADEHEAYISNKTWIEWHDKPGWNGSDVSVTEATYDTENDIVKLTYEIKSGTNYYNNPMQLFWHDPDMNVGHAYRLTLKIKSSVDCIITINEIKVPLSVGDNNVTVTFEHIAEGQSWDNKAIGTSLRIVFPDSGEGSLQGGSFEFSNMVITEISDADKTALVAPSFTLGAGNVISITDTNAAGVGSYELGFFANDTATTPSATVTVENGKAVDVSEVENATYTVRLRAKAESLLYTDSPWSTSGASLTVNNAGGPSYVLNMEVNDYPDAGKWGGWHDGGVTINSAQYKSGSVIIDFTSTGCTLVYGLQIKYENPNFQAGEVYSFDIVATANMNVQVIGGGEPAIALTAGQTKHIVGNSSNRFYLQVNQTATLSGKITISNVVWEQPQVTKLATPSFTYNKTTNVITITDTNTAGVGSYKLGFFKTGENTTTTELVVVNGQTVDLSTVPNNSYTIKLKAVAQNVLYTDSDWSDGDTITVENTTMKIGYSEEASLISGWAYWDSKAAADWNQWTAANCSECYMDGNGKITTTFTCTGTGAKWAMQMFYKLPGGGGAGNTTFTIKSSVATTIIVCDQEITLAAGEEKQVTVTNYVTSNGSAIAIQFGTTGGTFEIYDISCVAA